MQKLLDPDSGVRLAGFEKSWKTYQICEVAQVTSGGTPDTKCKAYWNGEIPWCTPSDISSAHKYLEWTQLRITKTGMNQSSATLLPAGSILMCSRASIGPRAISKIPICTNQGFKNFICKPGLSNEFFYYYLETIVPSFLKKAGGNTFKEVSKTDVEKQLISIPPKEEQVAIANILSTADREIDLLEQELDAWQQKRKALMQLLLTGLVRV